MASYSEMIAHIEELKKEAERHRKEEFGNVVKVIKKQIKDYNISARDLGFNGGPEFSAGKGAKIKKAKVSRKASPKSRATGVKVLPRYRDGNGNTWTGRGKQPRWLTSALASGQTLESFLIGAPKAEN